MALQPCPECRRKISESAEICIHCGVSFNAENLALYRAKLIQRQQHNREINRKSSKLQFIWLLIFMVVIVVANWYYN